MSVNNYKLVGDNHEHFRKVPPDSSTLIFRTDSVSSAVCSPVLAIGAEGMYVREAAGSGRKFFVYLQLCFFFIYSAYIITLRNLFFH